MRTIYDPSLKATVTLDDAGLVRGIYHLDEYREIEHLRGREAATAYVRDIAGKFNIAPEALRSLEQRVSYLDPHLQDVEYRFSEEKPLFDSATYAYYQTWLNTPVWAAGVTATVKQAPARVVAATNTSEDGIDAKMPSAEAIEAYRRLFSSGEKSAAVTTTQPKAKGAAATGIDGSGLLAEILGKTIKSSKAASDENALRLIRGRFFVYRYDSAKRTDDHPHPTPTTHVKEPGVTQDVDQPLCGTPPTLPLPPVPKSIQEGRWYLVAELIFRLPYKGGPMNWRMLVEVETNTILYLRALTSCANGLVFTADPITATGNAANSPAATAATLNPVRSSQALLGLTAPAPGSNQALTGNFVQISDFELATSAPPTEAPGANFNYGARTNNFAAVNAYYHCDRFFRLVENLGFTISSYFNGTSFPVPVDHRGRFLSLDGVERNASCSGDGDGIANVDFELADLTDTTNPMGIAADWRVVLHELGGHGILYDHVGTANFGFAHSAGDSFAVILNDPNTLAADRFESFPWVNFIGRRHDRSVAAGWGWGGANDVGSYSSEQILATTMFRVYRSLGGDSTDVGRREFAARCMAYLMLRAVGTLTPMSNPGTPAQFLTALLTADAGNWTSEGIYGGAYGKVFTWSFEKQNLNGGALPSVDVYIDDGRAGEYAYLPVHWATTTIWNRRNADNLAGHQEPALGETNYAYVKIKNRGTSVANNVVVKGYHCKPSAGVLWPNDLQAMTTTQLAAGTVQPNNIEEKVVGPFEWTPVTNAWGHDCMLMIVSASGDPSNVDNFTAGEVVEDWRLVPNDNNVAQRNVTLVPGDGLRGLVAGLHGKGFWVGNPGRTAATVAVSVALPPLLAKRGWRIGLHDFPENGARLKSHEQRLVTFDVHAGAPFTKADTMATTERDIVVTATADGAIIGGMVYHIDPDLDMPYNDRTPGDKTDGCRDKARQLLDCLDLPSSKVKCVRVRKVAIDIEMKDDDCGCD
ncbi:hypothetical protein GALLN_00362 [Gallionellaceae bacterium]|nr:hypothetical protein GALLN_00362 [Gallionellaceae bacterium]